MLFDILIIVLIVLLIIFIWIVYTRFFGAEFVRTPKKVRKTALRMLKLNKKDIFYDLGAGMGSLLLEASPKVKKAIGIEIDPLRFLIAYFRIRAKKLKNVELVFGNLFKVPLNNATKIFLFLSKEANKKMGQKLKKEAKEAVVVSYKWPITMLRTIEKNQGYRLYKHKI